MKVGIGISKKNGYSIISFYSHNILSLHIKHEVGIGYKGGDNLDVVIKDEGCTVWEKEAGSSFVRACLSGDSEIDTMQILLRCAAEMIEMRRMGTSEEEILNFINTNFRKRYCWDTTPQDLTEVKHKIHIGKYKGKLLEEIDDISYLRWMVDNVKLTPLLKAAIINRIRTLDLLLK